MNTENIQSSDSGGKTQERKGWLRAFLDFFVLFGGVSTASNLSRTQPRPVRQRGLFLFRRTASEDAKRDAARQ
jgi:hypothetical protein